MRTEIIKPEPLLKIMDFIYICQTKQGSTIGWEYFTEIFDYFPIIVILDDKIFAVHGGLLSLI
jgi:diadenosine tetraphosphatase ApaH/serine/threonine PP2A family protein phosphatase